MEKANLKAVAGRAGVSTATASYALRGLARVPEATRRRVEEAARALGYRVAPGLSAALSAVRRGDDRSLRHVIGVIGPEPLAQAKGGDRAWLRDLHAAVDREARRCGCATEYFSLGGRGATKPRALGRVMRARGIEGVVVLPVREEHRRLRIDWKELAAVAIGFSLVWPGLHRVANNTLPMIHEATKRLARDGARRIGLCLSREASLKYFRTLEAAFLLAQEGWRPAERVPVMVGDDPAELRAWFAKWRPDGLVGNHTALEALAADMAGLPPSRRLWLDLWPTQTADTGFIADFEGLGRAAVELLLPRLERGERGVPERPTLTMVAPFFREGGGRR